MHEKLRLNLRGIKYFETQEWTLVHFRKSSESWKFEGKSSYPTSILSLPRRLWIGLSTQMKNMLSDCQFIGRNPDFLMPLLLELPVLKHLQAPSLFFFSRRARWPWAVRNADALSTRRTAHWCGQMSGKCWSRSQPSLEGNITPMGCSKEFTNLPFANKIVSSIRFSGSRYWFWQSRFSRSI